MTPEEIMARIRAARAEPHGKWLISEVSKQARAEALQEAARVAEIQWSPHALTCQDVARDIAAAIRSLPGAQYNYHERKQTE